MHYDEYEISLSRELTICSNAIQRIQKSLGILERKHNKSTEAFIEERLKNAATSPEHKVDYDAWQSSYESLRKWQDLERQYREEIRKIKN